MGTSPFEPAPFGDPITPSRLAEILAGATSLIGVVWEAWLLPDGTLERIDFANAQVEALLGYPVEDWRREPNFWQSIVHPEDRTRAVGELREILAGGTGGTSRFRWVGRDGRVVWVETQAVVALDASGRHAATRGVTMNITERLAAEERLRYQLSHTAAITGSLAEGICTLDVDGKLIFLNPAGEQMLGYLRGELLGQSLHDLMHSGRPDAAAHPASACPLAEPVRTGKTHTSIEDDYRHRDGRWFPVRCSVAPIVTDGDVTGVAVAFHDLSGRIHAERLRSLRQSVTQVLVESLSLEETAGRVLESICRGLGWDAAALWLCEGKSDRLRCHSHWSRFPADAAGDLGFAPGALLASGLGLPGEAVSGRRAVWVRDSSASRFARAGVEARPGGRGALAFPIQVSDAVVGAIEVLSRDVREPDEEEVEVLASVGLQLGLFIERARAKQQMVAWNRELQTLLHVVSHDLREPLRGIESFSELLAERSGGNLDDKGRDYLRRILGSAGRLRRLLDDVMELSRARQIEPPTTEADGEMLVGEALGRLEHKIAETGAVVRVVQHPLPKLRVDRTWATLAIYNLIANALKFTRSGRPPEVEIAPYVSGAGRPSGLVVRDRGTGVAPEHAERIFLLFQRAVGRDIEGTGAGLAIVKAVATRHGGNAWVIPRPGGGSEFVITFGPTDPQH